jgi:hypothetical protein
MTRARSGNARAPYYRQLAHANPLRQNSLTNGFTKRGLISKKVPTPIVRIAHASIAMLWESHEEAVNTIFVGQGRQYDRRSPHMCSHHLVNLSPARGRKAQSHRLSRSLRRGFIDNKASVSKTCQVRFDSNKYSVSASAVGRPVNDTPALFGSLSTSMPGRTRMKQERPACYYIASGSVYLDSNITAFRDTLETMTGHERSACGGLGQYVLSDKFAWTIVQIEIDDDPIS